MGISVPLSMYNTFAGVLNPVADSNNWYSFYCTGFRATIDTTNGLAAFNVGNTIRFNAGYKNYASATATTTTA